MKWVALAGWWIAVLGSPLAAAEPNVFPYDDFARFSVNMRGEKVDGVEMIAAYLKAVEEGKKIEPAEANFRIRLPDGTSAPLRCEALPEKPGEGKTPEDVLKITAGFTHKLWIPKDPAKYAGGALLNDLPKGFLNIQFPKPPKPAK